MGRLSVSTVAQNFNDNYRISLKHFNIITRPISGCSSSLNIHEPYDWLCAYFIGAYMQNRLTNSQRYLVVGLVGLGLPLTVTIKVSRVRMVSARFSVN